MEWIPCSERLPDKERIVLFANKSFVEMGHRGNTAWQSQDEFWYSFDKVTHWMPLPAPPK